MSKVDMRHMEYLETISHSDIATLIRKEASYGGSWKKRGGPGAFMVSFRKADRLENIAGKYNYDIFKALAADMSGDDGTALAELRDLRQYLMLIEAEALIQLDDKTLLPGPLPEQFKPTRYTNRLEDGMCNNQIENEDVDYYILAKCGNYYVDRDKTPEDFWGHLPRLALTLTHKQYDQLEAYYRDLYVCVHDTWCLKQQYHKNWGRKSPAVKPFPEQFRSGTPEDGSHYGDGGEV